jgi:hypothetical protein
MFCSSQLSLGRTLSGMREEHTSHDRPSPVLWVRLAPEVGPDPDLRWVIAGASGTHRGRFHLCSVTGDHHRSASLYEVVEASSDALWWLDGFLSGQQADLWEFLGADSVLFEASDAADEERLREWNRRFQERGDGPSDLDLLPARDRRLSDLAAPLAWCYVGSLYRLWRDVDWVVADPQPPSDGFQGWCWPGSECETLGEHDLEAVDERPSICQRCHLVST